MAELEHKRHTLAHLLAAAIAEMYQHAKPTIGPSIDNGFYYDFDFDFSKDAARLSINQDSRGLKPLEEDLPRIEETMRGLLPSWNKFEHRVVSANEARDLFRDNPYKRELIDQLEQNGETITLYTCGGFTDLCRGGHAENPAMEIVPDSFHLDRIAGAYWRGDEENPMLTRIYGLAFDTKEELDSYLVQRAEAEKRDHRKLGRELDLFTFSELIGAGLPLYTPKGTVMREELTRYSEELQRANGFQKVWIPHITKTDLYKTSGHWDKFGHELMLVKSQESSDDFVLKPMNCPHHTQIYASRPRSYRELPIRYMETTTVYRDEKTGELSGLTRVRSLTQDDAHIFCTIDQIEQEFENIMSMIKTMYGTLGLSFTARLSFSDPASPEKYLGDRAQWVHAEKVIEEIAKKLDLDYHIAPGEAAFYGPKIDIMVMDALGRQWQCATQQLDFVQPVRFKLEYADKDGSKKTPVMIHKALLGTIDRFLGVYIEHTAGNFPLWLSPLQARILTISEAHAPFAREALRTLRDAGIRTELDDSNETLGKKIRDAKHSKIPYLLVIGDQEIKDQTATLESRDKGKIGALSIEDVAKRLKEEITKRV